MNGSDFPTWAVALVVVAVLALLGWGLSNSGHEEKRLDGWKDREPRLKNAWAKTVHETDSPIEEELLDAIRDMDGLPEPELQYELFQNGRRLTVPDMAYPDKKIAIFCDSKKYHTDVGQLIDDSQKRNRLSMQGWVVLVFWGPQIYKDSDACAREILEAYKLAS